MPYLPRQRSRRRSTNRRKRLWPLVIALLVVASAYWFYWGKDSAHAPATVNQTSPESGSEEPSYEALDLQPAVDAWLADQPYDYNIVIRDRQDGTIIAQHNPDKINLGASLYKLFVSYLVLQDFQAGVTDPEAVLVSGKTWRKCIEDMIRVSDNPCGETMTDLKGAEELHDRLSEIGIPDTTFHPNRTTANDTVKILDMIYDGKGLTKQNHQMMLGNLLNQPAEYKRGLPAGAPAGKWYSKAGWNMGVLYNDAAVLVLPDKREFTVVIMGPDSYQPSTVADFGLAVYKALTR